MKPKGYSTAELDKLLKKLKPKKGLWQDESEEESTSDIWLQKRKRKRLTW